jgi:hypothetical protein
MRANFKLHQAPQSSLVQHCREESGQPELQTAPGPEEPLGAAMRRVDCLQQVNAGCVLHQALQSSLVQRCREESGLPELQTAPDPEEPLGAAM